MNCPRCETSSPEHAAWCQSCGQRLNAGGVDACKRCGAHLPDNAVFCVACGTHQARSASLSTSSAGDRIRRLVPPEYLDRLMSASRSVSGSRRMVTMLFFDVSGSTAMFEDMDPEDVMEIMNDAFSALMPPVYRHEGTLARLMGDGVLAFFGAPVSHEDDASRACAAALEIVAAARTFAAALEETRGIDGFDVRVGVNTGLVVVGEVGDDHRVEYTAMGDAVNVAARLESSAAPGTILVSEDTRALVSARFELESLGDVALKGRVDTVAAWRLLAAASPRGIEGKQFDEPEGGRSWEELSQTWEERRKHATRVPAALQTVVQSRIDRLPPASRRILLTASVIDAPFERELLERSLRFDASAWELDEALSRLVRSEFLEATGTGAGTLYRFRHGLARDVAYASLLKSHRRLIHRRVAAALEAPGAEPGPEGSEIIAFHYTEAGDSRAASAWRERGGHGDGRDA